MINLYKTNNKLITNTYINLDYVKSVEKLRSLFSHSPLDTNIDNPSLFLNELIEYEQSNQNGVRKDRVINYGVVLTFMINNNKIKDKKLISLSKEIIKEYGLISYPCYCVVKRYKKSLYLVVYVCERKYYKEPKLFEVKAKKTRYKNNKGCYCNASDKEAKLVYSEGDIIRSYYSKFSSKTQKFRFANPKHFIKTMQQYKLKFINLCVKCLDETVRKTITFKRCNLRTLDYRQKNIARIWTKSFEEMEKSFNSAYMCLTCGEQDKLDKKVKQEINSIYQNFNEILINNYKKINDSSIDLKHFYSNSKKKIGFSVDLNSSIKVAKESSKLVKELFIDRLDNIISPFVRRNLQAFAI